jgi:WD40 repeat protein
MRSPALLLLPALLSFTACRSRAPQPDAAASSSASPFASLPPAPPGSPCEEARRLRTSVPGLLEEGRLDRGVRTIDRADRLCPAERATTWGVLAGALADLGEVERLRALAAEIDGATSASPADRDKARAARATTDAQAGSPPDTEEARKPMAEKMRQADEAWRAGQFDTARASYLDAWKLWHPNPRALAMAGQCAAAAGEKAEAQRLFDRALHDGQKLSSQLQTTQQHAILGPTRIDWSRDGRWIAMAHGDAISMLDGTTYLQRGPLLRGHTQKINALALSADGKQLASASADGTIRLWDPETGKLQHKLLANWNTVHAVAFSPDGKLLASDSNHLVRLWDVYTTRIKDTLKGHRDGVNAIAFSPDGAWVAAGAFDNRIAMWDVRSAGYLRSFNREGLPGSSIAFSPDGKMLATNTARKLLLWDTATGAVTRELGSKEWADFLAFQPEGKLLASASTGASADRVIRLWDATSGEPVRELKGHTGDPTAIAFSPDGKVVACGADDRTVMFWDVESGRLVHTVRRAAQKLSAVSLSEDGRSLAVVAADERVMVFDLEQGVLAKTIAAKATSVAFRSDGTLVAADQRDRSQRLLDGAAGRVTKEIAAEGASGPGSVVWSPDRKRAAVASTDGSISVTELDGGKAVARWKDTDRAHALVFSPDGKMLAVGAGFKDKAVRVYDAETGRLLRKMPGHKDRSTAIAFSPDGRFLASGSEDMSVQLWDARKWPPAHPLQTAAGMVTSIAFQADGSMMAAGFDDSVVRIWDPATFKLVRELAGHEAAVRAVAFARDGRLLASASDDGSVRLWDMPEGVALATLRVAGPDAWYVLGHAGSGHVSVGGANVHEAEQYLACSFGTLTLPFEVCRDRVTVSGFLGAVLRRTDPEN